MKRVCGEFSFAATYSEKEQTRKMSFYKNKEVNCTSCLMVRKILFCSEFSVIPEKWWGKEEKERQLQSVLLFKQTQKKEC